MNPRKPRMRFDLRLELLDVQRARREPLAGLDQPSVAVLDSKDHGTMPVKTEPDERAQKRVHPRRIPAAKENRD